MGGFLNYGDPYGVTIGVNPAEGSPGTPFQYWNLLIPDLRRLGIRKVRAQFSWSSIELTMGNYDWTVPDDFANNLNGANIMWTFPIRNAPSFRKTVQMSDEPWLQVNSTDYANFCTLVAQRYNNGPHGHVDRIELGNEEYNIHNSQPPFTFTLQQAVNNGSSYSTLTISALPHDMYLNGVAQFGTWGGTGQKFQLSAATSQNGTSLSIQAVGGGAFTANQNYANGSTISVQYTGTNVGSTKYWDGSSGISGANKAQPTRDPQYAIGPLIAGYNAIKAVLPNLPVGSMAGWWMQPKGGGIYNEPKSQIAEFYQFLYNNGAKGKMDYGNWHNYTNTTNPAVGSGSTVDINTILSELQAVRNAAGDTVPFKITEMGYQIPQDVPDAATQSAYYQTIYDACRLSGFVDEIDFFTLFYGGTGTGSSLVLNSGGSVTYNATFFWLQNYIAKYPAWGITPPSVNPPFPASQEQSQQLGQMIQQPNQGAPIGYTGPEIIFPSEGWLSRLERDIARWFRRNF